LHPFFVLRPELKSLASAASTVLVRGRVIEMHCNAPGTVDLLLRRTTVRPLEQGQPATLHPEIATDHLWIRFPDAVRETRPAPAGVSSRLNAVLRQEPVTLLERIALVGTCGFYTQANGALGIGIVQVHPVVSEHRLQALVMEAQECFLGHPWDRHCLEHLRETLATARRYLAEDLIVLTQPAAKVLKLLERVEQVCERNHRAERRARDGRRELAAGSVVMLDPKLSATSLFDAVRGASATDRLKLQQRMPG
jgi:hypothetical protein